MFLCFGIASGQETPQKKKSTVKTDSVYNKKHKQNQPTRKTDSIKHTQKKKGTEKPVNKSTVPPRKDTISSPPRP